MFTVFRKNHKPAFGALEILKYIGPGFLVMVGFIDPGNWAANVAAGAAFGYKLLWMVTLSTLMLILLQHNAAHLGIATGLCLAEAVNRHLRPRVSRPLLISAVLASISTALAEILGAAIGLKMLTGLPLALGAPLTAVTVAALVLTNSYRRIERWILGLVSLIGLAFVVELSLVRVDWAAAAGGWVTPAFPAGSLPIIMSVLGAVVMPHNLFLHSEIIQSRQWNLQSEEVIKRQLKYEFVDTLLAMSGGWAINSAMILVAAAVFFHRGLAVTELSQAQAMLKPLLGDVSAVVFAGALLLAGFASAVTASMAGGSIFAGMFGEPFHIRDPHSRTGVLLTLGGALAIVFLLADPFQGLLWSQIALSIQLPWTIFALITLTSAPRVMGRFANSRLDKALLWAVALIVTFFNLLLLRSFF